MSKTNPEVKGDTTQKELETLVSTIVKLTHLANKVRQLSMLTKERDRSHRSHQVSCY